MQQFERGKGLTKTSLVLSLQCQARHDTSVSDTGSSDRFAALLDILVRFKPRCAMVYLEYFKQCLMMRKNENH